MKLKTLFLFFCSFIFALSVNAVISPSQDSISLETSSFRFYKDIDNIAINVPTVVEIPFVNDFMERFDFVVLDKVINSFEPYFFKQEALTNEIPISISTSPYESEASLMNDQNLRTYTDFVLPENTEGHVQITLSSPSPITSSTLTTLLADNVALPNFVEIRALVGNQNRIVVAKQRMNQQTVRFPQTISNQWTVSFDFGQPLRISELRLSQDNATKFNTRAVRFLAQPNHFYRIYFDSDRALRSQFLGESGDLSSAQDVLTIAPVLSQSNPSYIIADSDNDGVPDIRDNCVSVSNAVQQDLNNNNRGDACDDFDKDGITNNNDNCPNNPNYNQADKDHDGIGDVCDKEESRVTERYAWIPWVGMGFAAVVLITLLALTAKSTRGVEKKDN